MLGGDHMLLLDMYEPLNIIKLPSNILVWARLASKGAIEFPISNVISISRNSRSNAIISSTGFELLLFVLLFAVVVSAGVVLLSFAVDALLLSVALPKNVDSERSAETAGVSAPLTVARKRSSSVHKLQFGRS